MSDVLKNLQASAADVYYEVTRLFEAAKLYPHTPEEKGKRLIIEALLLHFRNVAHFFFGQPQQDDVHASHFFDDTLRWSPAKPSWHEEYRKRCNKLLAHLTYSRVGYGERGEMKWILEDKLQVIQETWVHFIDQLPPERRLWFR